jgi:hypothetical protein
MTVYKNGAPQMTVYKNGAPPVNSWEEQGRLYQQFELCEGSLQELAETENNIPERLIWGYLVDLLQVPTACNQCCGSGMFIPGPGS